MASIKYQRTGTVLNRVYVRFMIPAMLSAIGISLLISDGTIGLSVRGKYENKKMRGRT
jgi:hypothetical protein